MRALTIELVEQKLSQALRSGHAVDIAYWSRQLDELDQRERERRESVSMLSAALWYASQGLHVFPLQPLTKRPWSRSRGCHDATSDAAQLRRWWSIEPRSNVGIATGHIVDVIDVDGYAANVELLTRFGSSDETWAELRRVIVGQVSTPRTGGRHLYVLTTQRSRGNRARMRHSALDYRGAGGYVVAPPSTTDARDSQVTGVYRWLKALEL